MSRYTSFQKSLNHWSVLTQFSMVDDSDTHFLPLPFREDGSKQKQMWADIKVNIPIVSMNSAIA